MSMNMDMDGGTDYADFDYDHVVFETALDPDGSASPNPRAIDAYSIEPLAGRGGLDNNEVAELVYMEVNPSVEPEDEDTGDQNVGTAVEFRGIIGANLPEGKVLGGGTDNISREKDANRTYTRDLSGNRGPRIKFATDDRIFQQFMARSVYPFDDQNTGPGGGSLDAGNVYEKNWRQLTGRGPVLDANDDITGNIQIVAGDLIGALSATCRIHMVWDTATVDDAGRTFSLP